MTYNRFSTSKKKYTHSDEVLILNDEYSIVLKRLKIFTVEAYKFFLENTYQILLILNNTKLTIYNDIIAQGSIELKAK